MKLCKDVNGKCLKHWTSEEIKVLEDNKDSSAEVISKILGRSVSSIEQARKRFGLQKHRKTKQQIEEELKELYSQGLEDPIIATRMGLSCRTIYFYRNELGLPPNGVNGGRKNRTGLFERRGKQLQGVKRRGWSEEEIQFIKDNYPAISLKKLAKQLGRSSNALQEFLLKIGLIQPENCGERATLFYFTDNQNEFLLAITKFRAEHGRIPTLIEGYRIAMSLGWRKETTGDAK